MIGHNLNLAWRQLVKYRLQSVVSIVSLAIGFACFALAMLWIRYERTYDTQHPNAERLYMVYDKEKLFAPEPLANYLGQNLPEVEEFAGVYPTKEYMLIDGVQHRLNAVICDSNFLNIMGLRIISGNADFWMQPDKMAVTEEFATKVWGTENPIGKTCASPFSSAEYTITAVVSSYGEHSNIPFDILYGFCRELNWNQYQSYALIRLQPNVDGEAFIQKMDTFVVKVPEVEESWGTRRGFDYKRMRAVRLSDFRQVLSDSGLTPWGGMTIGIVQFRHIRLIALAGGLLILSGLLNYLTMFLNRVIIRRREVVLRSVFGASTRSIMGLFLTEYIMLLFISLWFGQIFMDLLMPWFVEMTGVNVTGRALYIETGFYASVITLLGILLSIPAIWYFRHKSVQQTLQGRGVQHTYQNFRKTSVVVQMIISIGFIFCTVVMMLQLEKLRNTDPGFQRKEMAVLCIDDDYVRNHFGKQLDEIPEIVEWHEGFSLFPQISMLRFSLTPNGEGNRIMFTMVKSAKDYQDFYGLKLKEGRWLEEGDKDGAVITEAGVKEMGLENPIGTWLRLSEDVTYTIIGVVEDVFSEGPTVKANPYLFCNDLHGNSYGHNPLLIKYYPGKWSELCNKLHSLLDDPETGKRTYELYNCEEEFDKIIISELTLKKLMTAISVVCILISLFGIWSMIMLNCEQRRKEIAIRKIHGATVNDILGEFAFEYGLLLIIAAAVAFPIGYACMKPWVEQYVVQTEISWWIYVGIFLMVALLVALCVGWRVWKTAKARPADEICKG